MAFMLPSLPYAYDDLEPFIDEETMKLHHTKHHQTYVDKLNAALEGTDYLEMSLEELLQSIDILPVALKTAVRNHGGGHRNHSLFRASLTPDPNPLSPAFEKIFISSFGSFDTFKQQFSVAAAGLFGSGRVWLVKKYDELEIISTPNQDNPLMKSEKAILGLDVWEHAYYLKYQNRRPEYISSWWNVVNRDFVEKSFNSR